MDNELSLHLAIDPSVYTFLAQSWKLVSPCKKVNLNIVLCVGSVLFTHISPQILGSDSCYF